MRQVGRSAFYHAGSEIHLRRRGKSRVCRSPGIRGVKEAWLPIEGNYGLLSQHFTSWTEVRCISCEHPNFAATEGVTYWNWCRLRFGEFPILVLHRCKRFSISLDTNAVRYIR